jgi:amino acid transporter
MVDDGTDVKALREGVAEFRRAYDKQVDALNNVDDRALRTGRTAVIVLGIAGSVVAAIGPESVATIEQEVRWLMGLGMGLVFLSAVSSYLTFGTTDYPGGVGPDHLDILVDPGVSEAEWLLGTLRDYQNWQEETNRVLQENVEGLEEAMTLLVLGMFFVLFSLLLSFFNQIHGIEPLTTISAIITLIILLIVIFIALAAFRFAVTTVRGYIN